MSGSLADRVVDGGLHSSPDADTGHLAAVPGRATYIVERIDRFGIRRGKRRSRLIGTAADRVA
jgi:hypothetical protein